jgi:hypothetical protein
VPPETLAHEGKPLWGLRLSRREMLIFGIGALLGAVVAFLGALLAFKQRE